MHYHMNFSIKKFQFTLFLFEKLKKEPDSLRESGDNSLLEGVYLDIINQIRIQRPSISLGIFCLSIIFTSVFNLEKTFGQSAPGTANSDYLFLNKQLVIPPSSEPSSLGEFGEYVVNKYTGTPSIDIPIYTIAGNELSIILARHKKYQLP